jgi:hypothetical protein
MAKETPQETKKPATLYQLLRLDPRARPEDIERAYKRFRVEMDDPSAAPDARREAQMKAAYDTLSDPEKRAAYDEQLKKAVFVGAAPPPKPERTKALLAVAVLLAVAGGAFFYLQPKKQPPAAIVPGISEMEVHTAASVAVGRVSRLEMSGARSNLGAAVAIEPGVMITPCSGLVPGTQILVRIPPRDMPAEVKQADEATGFCKVAVTGGASSPLPLTAVPARIGDAVFAASLGPLGEVIILPGEVKKVISGEKGRVIESTARVGPPIDGTPLLDNRGQIIAIAVEGKHITLPASIIPRDPLPARKGPVPPPDSTPAADSQAPAAQEEDPRLKNVSPERRERLEKGFRPPPKVPSDL